MLLMLLIAKFLVKTLHKPSSNVERTHSRAVYNNVTVDLMDDLDENDGDNVNNLMITTVTAISCLCLCCCVPFYLTISFLSSSKLFTLITFLLSVFRSFINPLVCIIVNPEFRNLIRKLKFW